MSRLPEGWRLVQKQTCYVLQDGDRVVASLAGPEVAENAIKIAKVLEGHSTAQAAIDAREQESTVGDGWLLDSEGRRLVGASHHYTAANVKALIWELKALEDPRMTTQADFENRDWRAWCGTLHRILSGLASEVPLGLGDAAPAPAAAGGVAAHSDEALICNKCGYVGTEHHHLRAGKTEACPYVARHFTLSDIWTAEDNKRLSEQLAAIRAANRKHNGILWQRMRAQGDNGPWKVGDEFLPYHPSASHCSPDYRDGWNHCYAFALAQPAPVQQEAAGEKWFAVLNPSRDEGVIFKSKRDARYAATGNTSGRFGVPTIADGFREAYEEETKFETIEVAALTPPAVAAPAQAGETGEAS